MKRIIEVTLCAWIFLAAISYTPYVIDSAFAQNTENYIMTVHSNNTWILNKTTRKLIFIQFKDEDEVWKSEQVIVPANFNLESCFLEAVGSRGTSVFLCDRSSGLLTFYEVKKDHSIEKYLTVDLQTELK